MEEILLSYKPQTYGHLPNYKSQDRFSMPTVAGSANDFYIKPHDSLSQVKELVVEGRTIWASTNLVIKIIKFANSCKKLTLKKLWLQFNREEVYVSDISMTLFFKNDLPFYEMDGKEILVKLKSFKLRANNSISIIFIKKASKKRWRDRNELFIATEIYGVSSLADIQCAVCGGQLLKSNLYDTTILKMVGCQHHISANDEKNSKNKFYDPAKLIEMACMSTTAKGLLDCISRFWLHNDCHNQVHDKPNSKSVSYADDLWRKNINWQPRIFTDETFFNNFVEKHDSLLINANQQTLSDLFETREKMPLTYQNFIMSMS